MLDFRDVSLERRFGGQTFRFHGFHGFDPIAGYRTNQRKPSRYYYTWAARFLIPDRPRRFDI